MFILKYLIRAALAIISLSQKLLERSLGAAKRLKYFHTCSDIWDKARLKYVAIDLKIFPAWNWGFLGSSPSERRKVLEHREARIILLSL